MMSERIVQWMRRGVVMSASVCWEGPTDKHKRKAHVDPPDDTPGQQANTVKARFVKECNIA
jgi:hypothetical protein